MASRIGVDVGGTFTDLIAYDDETGDVRVAKVPTTREAPQRAVVDGLATAVPDELLQSSEYFLHGSTVPLNAVLERKGARVGLLATDGFRDVLEIRRGDRGEMLNLWWRPPLPLVPRRLRLPVRERIRADGSVHRELESADLERALDVFRSEEVESIAVAFINSYANPSHELAAERLLADLGFQGDITLSHRVSGEYREYERTSTAVVDAYVRPVTAAYVRKLEQALRRAGCPADLLIMRSGGGAMSFAEAVERPFETIMSGPVAGAEGAAQLSDRLGIPEVISADVGGTSFDTCLVRDGRPQAMYEGSVDGLPVQAPWVDVRSIGSGGGSIAFVDRAGLLKVGPRSAGAVPGPASYGRGGTDATVTDAALLLGMLGEGSLAGGITLDPERARAAVGALAASLDRTIEDVARGIVAVASAQMADAIHEITVERGRDPRRVALMAFGGAGPLFATLLARELQIPSIVIPPHAGNFSAWGLLGADITRTLARTWITELSDQGLRDANRVLADLFRQLASPNGAKRRSLASHPEVALDMRYRGQEYSLTIPLEENAAEIAATPTAVAGAFSEEYERTFGHLIEERIEIVAVRATVRTPLPWRAQERLVADERPGTPARSFRAFSFSRQEWMDFQLVNRTALRPGSTLSGPALVLEPTATTYLDADFTAEVGEENCLVLRAQGVST